MKQRIYIDTSVVGGYYDEEFEEATALKTEKKFDAVKMMREIRDKISAETQNMTFEELRAYIDNKLIDSKTKPIGQKKDA
jgi:hypothetical protein